MSTKFYQVHSLAVSPTCKNGLEITHCGPWLTYQTRMTTQ